MMNVLLQLYALKVPVIPIAFNMHYASADKSLNSFQTNIYLNQQPSGPSSVARGDFSFLRF